MGKPAALHVLTDVHVWDWLLVAAGGLGIAVSEPFSLETGLGITAVGNAWGVAGLPADAASRQSAFIAAASRRTPLAIDPHGHAAAWVRALEASNDLCVIHAGGNGDQSALHKLAGASQAGRPVLLEDVDDAMVSLLAPLHAQPHGGSGACVHIGEATLHLAPGFRLYMTSTAHANWMPEAAVQVRSIVHPASPCDSVRNGHGAPLSGVCGAAQYDRCLVRKTCLQASNVHIRPDSGVTSSSMVSSTGFRFVCMQVALVDFSVTPDGLEEHLTVAAAAAHAPDAETQHAGAASARSEHAAALRDAEDGMLRALSDSGGGSRDVLSDDGAVGAALAAATAAAGARAKLAEARADEAALHDLRNRCDMLPGCASSPFLLAFVIQSHPCHALISLRLPLSSNSTSSTGLSGHAGSQPQRHAPQRFGLLLPASPP